MFFVVSKTLGIMLLPTNFMIGLGLIGVILLMTRWRRLGRGLMILALTLLAICAWSPLGKFLLYPLETRFPVWDATRGAPDGIIVLGGPIDADLSVTHGRAVISAAGDRIITAALLAHRYPMRGYSIPAAVQICFRTMRGRRTSRLTCSKASASPARAC